MKNKIGNFLQKYWILLIFLSIFSWFVLPACFQNNEDINIVSAEHVDSGSILSSILQLYDKSRSNSFYNQNIPYHTSFYGFPFNSVLFWIFALISLLFRVSLDEIQIFALIAKLLNFLFALLSIIIANNLINKIFKHTISRIFYLMLFCLFTPFIHYSIHIKSDILGLLLSLISITYLYSYLLDKKITKNIILANIFGGLSILCKQPHVFIIFSLLLLQCLQHLLLLIERLCQY